MREPVDLGLLPFAVGDVHVQDDRAAALAREGGSVHQEPAFALGGSAAVLIAERAAYAPQHVAEALITALRVRHTLVARRAADVEVVDTEEAGRSLGLVLEPDFAPGPVDHHDLAARVDNRDLLVERVEHALQRVAAEAQVRPEAERRGLAGRRDRPRGKGAQQGRGGGRRARGTGEKVALQVFDPLRGQIAVLVFGLDPLGKRVDAEFARHLDELDENFLLVGVGVDAADELAVELDEVGSQQREQV